ncbi:MAG: hypothetical protein RSN88_11680, partial [Gordonibacter sp.]|uniref:hypothetical protein n=1 Tax=Gordonibacter sp. TaxID=1968902 RepID=UPI002FCA1A48
CGVRGDRMLTIEQVDELCVAKRAYQRAYDLTVYDRDAAAEEGSLHIFVSDMHKLREVAAACGATLTRSGSMSSFEYRRMRFYSITPEKEGCTDEDRD